MTTDKFPKLPRQFTRRWKIACHTGDTMETLPLTHHSALEVARWFDEHFPDCAPHVVESRERRAWAERKAAK